MLCEIKQVDFPRVPERIIECVNMDPSNATCLEPHKPGIILAEQEIVVYDGQYFQARGESITVLTSVVTWFNDLLGVRQSELCPHINLRDIRVKREKFYIVHDGEIIGYKDRVTQKVSFIAGVSIRY